MHLKAALPVAPLAPSLVMSDAQAKKALELLQQSGQPVEFVSLPTAAHALHNADPKLFADTVVTWSDTLAA